LLFFLVPKDLPDFPSTQFNRPDPAAKVETPRSL
jgi:hypothetical protein